jgi:SnoaL-like domain
MRRVVIATLVATGLAVGSGLARAQSQTEKEVTQTIIDSAKYTNANLKGQEGAYSRSGALEFWSSGGLLQEIPPGTRPDTYESIVLTPKNIQVITLVEGQAAVANYYSEGTMKPKGSQAVSHYLTRATQVFVKEDGKWKIRSSHWSPIAGGTGTSQTTQ